MFFAGSILKGFPVTASQVEGSLGALRQGLQGHEESLSKLSRDVSERAQDATQEMTDFKDKVTTLIGQVMTCCRS